MFRRKHRFCLSEVWGAGKAEVEVPVTPRMEKFSIAFKKIEIPVL